MNKRRTLGQTALASAGTMLVGAVMFAADIEPGWAWLAVTLAIAQGVRAKLDELSWASVAYRVIWWEFAAVWVYQAASNSPWSWSMFTVLMTVSGISWIIGPVVAWRDRVVRENNSRLLMLGAYRRRIAQWRMAISVVTKLKGYTVADVRDWPNKYGYDVHVNMQETGRQWRFFKPHEGGLATYLDLPIGCSVIVREGASRGWAMFKVMTYNAMQEERVYPVDRLGQVTSIDDPISLGFTPDGEEATANVHWQRVLVAGPPEQGKSNGLRTMIAEILKTDNAIVRIIDLNGGGLAWPFLRLWQNGEVKQPTIDWVGFDPMSAALCAEDTLWEVMRRKREEGKWMVEDDKMPAGDGRPGNPPPAIILIVDEGAEVGGAAATPEAKRAKKAIAEIKRIGRGSGVNVIDSVVRGTNDVTGNSTGKRISGTRILVRVQDAVEGQHVFGSDTRNKIDPQDAPYPGCGWWSEFGQSPRLFRYWRTVGGTIDAIVRATDGRRPVCHASPNYATRWDRLNTPAEVAAQAGPPAVAQAPGAMGEIKSRFDSAMGRLRAHRAAQDPNYRDPKLAREFAEAVAGWDLDFPSDARPNQGEIALTWEAYAEFVVGSSGRNGIGATPLMAKINERGFDPSRATVYRWLGQHARIKNQAGRWTWQPDTTQPPQ